MFAKTVSFQNTTVPYYDSANGCGFVTEETRRGNELLGLLELNAGFEVPYWYREERVTEIRSDAHGCYIDTKAVAPRIGADVWRLIPLCCKIDVPSTGNYEVEVNLYGQGEILVFAGPRRLVYRESVASEGSVSVRFLLNVCEIIPRGKTFQYDRKSVDIAVLGDMVRLAGLSIRQVDCATLYIAGDSTVTDQPAEYPYAPGASYAGWGQMLGYYLCKDASVVVSNHAHSGLTVESFRSEGHYAIIRSHIKAGDYLFLQFGHNDQKLMHLKAKEGYRDGILAYIDETIERGAYPVLVTPLARNSWKADDGTYNDLLSEYAEECIRIGKERNIPVIDLHARSMDFIMDRGLEDVKPYFYPGDFTHTNDYGAYLMAGFIAEEYRKGSAAWFGAYVKLAELFETEKSIWEAGRPQELELPVIPDGYQHVQNPQQVAPLFAQIERPDDTLTRVEALELVIQAARFFPTNVFNDIYDDIVGHEWYAGTVQCAYQNGIILPQMIVDQRFEPDRAVTLEEFLVFFMGGYRSRRKMPTQEACALDAQCSDYAVPFVRAAYTLGAVSEDDCLRDVITRGRAAGICMALPI